MDLGLGFLSPQTLPRPLPQGGAGQDPLLQGVDAPVGQEREQRFLAWASLGFILWSGIYMGLPRLKLPGALARTLASLVWALWTVNCLFPSPPLTPTTHSSSTNP